MMEVNFVKYLFYKVLKFIHCRIDIELIYSVNISYIIGPILLVLLRLMNACQICGCVTLYWSEYQTVLQFVANYEFSSQTS